MEINTNILPAKQKLIFIISNKEELYENYDLNKDLVKILKHKQNFNIYRYDKFLDPKIKPFDFMYYYKNIDNRSRLMNTKINLIKKISENESNESIIINDKNYSIKVLSNDFQIIMYLIDDDLIMFDLFNLKVRKHDNKYMIRLEIAYNIFNIDQEIDFKKQIQLLNDFERVILNQK